MQTWEVGAACVRAFCFTSLMTCSKWRLPPVSKITGIAAAVSSPWLCLTGNAEMPLLLLQFPFLRQCGKQQGSTAVLWCSPETARGLLVVCSFKCHMCSNSY